MKHVTLTLMLAASASIISMAAASPEEQPVHIARAALPVKFDNVVETIMIDNQRYEVPEPWAGNRLFPTTRNLDELRPIPPEYAYDGSEIYILAEALEPFVEMAARAHQDGVELLAESAYRSVHYQARIFKKRMKEGYRYEDIVRYVAPPGYSQHMLGTAIDFYPSNWEFAESEQYRWLQEHAGEFGFEETFSRHNRYNISWESWHWNYVGKAEPGLTAGIGIDIEEEIERIE
ncbi:MAG: M15 family metallopeptidase [Desulfofustis sp.]|jgi:LAS superfamily LD-carboxypeptidase LdcB|nr:M15 family metallopeptidase [Desulfofustis sp.]